MADLRRVHTHELNDGRRLSRLNAYRLKAARRRRDEAIAAAHERYARDVATLTGDNDRLATLALVRGEAANTTFSARQPAEALVDPQSHALTAQLAAQAVRTVRAMARRLCGWSEVALTEIPDYMGRHDAADAFRYFAQAAQLRTDSPPCAHFSKPAGLRALNRDALKGLMGFERG